MLSRQLAKLSACRHFHSARDLDLLTSSENYYVIGQGGLGSAVSQILISQNKKVTTISRHGPTEEQPSNSHHITLDVTNENCVETLQTVFSKRPPRYVINTVGVLQNDKYQPEKTITNACSEWLHQSIAINTLPTLYLARALHPTLTQTSPLTLLTISARVGSISDNKLGGWTSYRMSKAALNMLVKNISIEWRNRRFREASCVAYHPGTVDTGLSKPFQTNVPKGKLFTAQFGAECLLEVLHEASSAKSGQLIAFDGSTVAY